MGNGDCPGAAVATTVGATLLRALAVVVATALLDTYASNGISQRRAGVEFSTYNRESLCTLNKL